MIARRDGTKKLRIGTIDGVKHVLDVDGGTTLCGRAGACRLYGVKTCKSRIECRACFRAWKLTTESAAVPS